MNDMSFSGTKISGSEPAVPPGTMLLSGNVSAFGGDPNGTGGSRGGRWRIRAAFAFLAAMMDFLAICGAAFLSNYIFNYIVYSRTELSTQNLTLGFFAAILFVAFNIIRYAYSMSNYLDIAGHAQRTFIQWNTAFIAATAFGFMMKSLEESSRGTFVVLYFLGLFALYTGRAAMVHIARSQARNGGILSVRIAVVGFERDVRKFMGLRDPRREAINVVAVHLLPENDVEIRAALVDTIAVARNRMPDEIYIVVPWSRTEAIDMCISAFMELPVSIHLNVDPDSVINRLANAQLGTNGARDLILRALLADARLGLAHSGLSIYSQGDNPDRVTRRHDTGTLESQLAVLEKLRRKLPGLPFDPAFELGFSYYNLARLAYTHGFVREGRSAEAAARALGIVGHPGSRGHAFLASIMSLAGKQLLAYQVRKVLRMLKGWPGGSAARIRATEDSAGAVGTGA